MLAVTSNQALSACCAGSEGKGISCWGPGSCLPKPEDVHCSPCNGGISGEMGDHPLQQGRACWKYCCPCPPAGPLSENMSQLKSCLSPGHAPFHRCPSPGPSGLGSKAIPLTATWGNFEGHLSFRAPCGSAEAFVGPSSQPRFSLCPVLPSPGVNPYKLSCALTFIRVPPRGRG